MASSGNGFGNPPPNNCLIGPQIKPSSLNLLRQKPFEIIQINRADLHLAPIIVGFATALVGGAMLPNFPDLARPWQALSPRQTLLAPETGLPTGD
jgi:hypothetical protein